MAVINVTSPSFRHVRNTWLDWIRSNRGNYRRLPKDAEGYRKIPKATEDYRKPA